MAQLVYNEFRTIGFAGQLATANPNEVSGMRNDEASTSLPFGTAVKYDSTTDSSSAGALTAITGELVAGIVLKQESYTDTQLDDVGVKPGNHLNVVRKGNVLVVCEDGCSVGDRLHIRAIATGAEVAGALRATADGTDTIDSTKQGQWRSAATAGNLAWLEVDFSREID